VSLVSKSSFHHPLKSLCFFFFLLGDSLSGSSDVTVGEAGSLRFILARFWSSLGFWGQRAEDEDPKKQNAKLKHQRCPSHNTMSTTTVDHVADWRTYRENMRTRRAGQPRTTATTATANPTTHDHPTTNNNTTTTNNNTTTTTNHVAEQWRQKYLALEQKSTRLVQQQQHTVREQVQQELTLARQKSIVLGEQVEALEVSAAELDERTAQRDEIATQLRMAMSKLEELNTTNQDLRVANDRLTQGLDVAMNSAQTERKAVFQRQERERELQEESDKNATLVNTITQQAEERIEECTAQLKEALRLNNKYKQEINAMKEQMIMERHVATEKVQEFASKLQVALISRDESAHTYQLALAESQDKYKALDIECNVLKQRPDEVSKLKKKLKKTKKKLTCYERQVRYDTENLRRETNTFLTMGGNAVGFGGGGVERRRREKTGRGVKGGGGGGVKDTTTTNDTNVLSLQSIAGKELMIAHTLAVGSR